MKIVKHGKAKLPKTYKCRCKSCGCVYKICENEPDVVWVKKGIKFKTSCPDCSEINVTCVDDEKKRWNNINYLCDLSDTDNNVTARILDFIFGVMFIFGLAIVIVGAFLGLSHDATPLIFSGYHLVIGTSMLILSCIYLALEVIDDYNK